MSSMFGDLNPVENRKFSFKFLFGRYDEDILPVSALFVVFKSRFLDFKNGSLIHPALILVEV